MIAWVGVWIVSFAIALTCQVAAAWSLWMRGRRRWAVLWVVPPIALYCAYQQRLYALCALWLTSLLAYAAAWLLM